MPEERARETKNLLLRLDPVLARRVELVARIDGQSVSDTIRAAIAEHVERRRGDEHFRRLLQEQLAQHAEMLASLDEL